jgi:hypothetical protein
VAAYDRHKDHDKEKKKHTNDMRKRPKGSTSTPFVPPRGEKSSKSGYIVWLDKKPVVFYSNDLLYDVPGAIIGGRNEEAIKCVHGLVKIKQWLGDESMHRSEFDAPAVVLAYNIFMNGVDRMDQIRAVNPSK